MEKEQEDEEKASKPKGAVVWRSKVGLILILKVEWGHAGFIARVLVAFCLACGKTSELLLHRGGGAFMWV